MDKKIKFSEQPMKVKITYAVVVAVLCITAIVVGIVSVASRKEDTPVDNLPDASDTANSGSSSGAGDSLNDEKPSEENDNKTPEKLTMVAPVVGEITKSHSTELPVFSTTLNEWRVHTGIDISSNEGNDVYSAASGEVTAVYSDHFLGKTVEITHDGGVVSVYSNLDASSVSVEVGDRVASGDKIAKVGDSSLTELADEPHLHFEVKVNGVSVNPLDYISEDSKEASLGIGNV